MVKLAGHGLLASCYSKPCNTASCTRRTTLLLAAARLHEQHQVHQRPATRTGRSARPPRSAAAPTHTDTLYCTATRTRLRALRGAVRRATRARTRTGGRCSSPRLALWIPDVVQRADKRVPRVLPASGRKVAVARRWSSTAVANCKIMVSLQGKFSN
jgi:hypothetical protein